MSWFESEGAGGDTVDEVDDAARLGMEPAVEDGWILVVEQPAVRRPSAPAIIARFMEVTTPAFHRLQSPERLQ